LMTDTTPGLCPPCDKLVHERYWAEDHCVICDLEKQRDGFKERNHHAIDLARLSKAPLRADCRRVDHAMEDVLEALDRVVSGLEAVAEHECEYGDGCPKFASLNHYRCQPCLAREALREALGEHYFCSDAGCPTCRSGEPCH